MAPWQKLLHRTIEGLVRLDAAGQPIPQWVLGGGTALMIRAGHRLSKDIDAFIEDPQYLSFLSPRLAGEAVWACRAYEESANHLRLVYPEGEIDFIVASPLTELPSERKMVAMGDVAHDSHEVLLEHPVEIAIKKLAYRGSMLKVRDVFDIAVVNQLFPELLRENLRYLAHLKQGVLGRLGAISDDYWRLEIEELDIAKDWREFAQSCREQVRSLIAAIPN